MANVKKTKRFIDETCLGAGLSVANDFYVQKYRFLMTKQLLLVIMCDESSKVLIKLFDIICF